MFPKGCFEKLKPTNQPTIRLNPVSCVTASLDTCISTSLHHNSKGILESIIARKEAMATFAQKFAGLVDLYERVIESRFQAVAHERNAFIVQAVPFLYRVVAPPLVVEFVGLFYDCNCKLYNDSREQHMREAKAMLDSVVQSYSQELHPDERAIYQILPEIEQSAFRICRDLALLLRPERPPLTFYIGFGHLSERLQIHPMQAQRLVRRFEVHGLLRLITKGNRRAAGVPRYRRAVSMAPKMNTVISH